MMRDKKIKEISQKLISNRTDYISAFRQNLFNYINEKEEYREKIIEMVKKIENVRYLKFIYDLFISFKNKWGI